MRVHICVHARYRMCICAHVCVVCSFSVGEHSLWGHLLLGVGGYFKTGVLSVSFLFLTRVGVYVGVCVYTPTHTHNAQMGYSVVSPGVGMRHLPVEGPKNPDGHIYRHIYICICVQRTHVYVNDTIIRRRDEIMDWLFFSLTYFFFRKRKAKDVHERKPSIISNLKKSIWA